MPVELNLPLSWIGFSVPATRKLSEQLGYFFWSRAIRHSLRC
jgi:hypothetical protein